MPSAFGQVVDWGRYREAPCRSPAIGHYDPECGPLPLQDSQPSAWQPSQLLAELSARCSRAYPQVTSQPSPLDAWLHSVLASLLPFLVDFVASIRQYSICI